MTASRTTPLDGVHAALVTPLTADAREVATGAIGPLLDLLGRKSLTGVLVLGSTGEFASLAHREKLEVIAEAAATRGRLRLIVGCGASSIAEVRELVEAASRRGADAVLVPPPFYYRNATPAGLEAWFDAVLDASPLPVVLYHIPALTGIAIDRKMLERLAERHENLLGLKDSGGRIQETNRFLGTKPGRVFIGSDASALAGLEAGASGLISASANVVPNLVCRLYQARKNLEAAEPLMRKLLEIRAFLKQFPLQAALKAWLTSKGIPTGQVRLPLCNLNEFERDDVSKFANLVED